MKIKLVENHSFKKIYVEYFKTFLDKELSAEEVIQIMVRETFVPTEFIDGVVYVDHPNGW